MARALSGPIAMAAGMPGAPSSALLSSTIARPGFDGATFPEIPEIIHPLFHFYDL
ncbi:MAG: hypothetical protein WDM89_20595 [Rhizomicrobium sp.]